MIFSPAGRSFVTVGADAWVKVWDFPGQRAEKAWELRWPVLGVAFAPDGRHFATANGNSTIYLFRPGMGTEAMASR